MNYADWIPPWDEIKRLAKDAGFAQDEYGDVAESTWDSVARLVFTVQQAERTRIAELVESARTCGMVRMAAADWPCHKGHRMLR